MSPLREQNKSTIHEMKKEGREKWTFYFAIVRTIAAIISLTIAIAWANGGGFVPLP